MEISALFFFIFFLLSPISIKAQTTPTTTTHCSHGSPPIHLPFTFNLSCSSNTTRIHFKSYDSLSIKSISYDKKRLDLIDLNGCVHGAFLKLNLSLTPFRYFYVVRDYKYLNCTSKLLTPSPPIPCLSRPRDYYVYVVREMEETPRFCKEVKKVKIPFEYSPYLDDGSFGLSLTWGPNDDEGRTESQRGCLYKAPNYEGVSLLVAMVVISLMVIIKICHSKKQKFLKEEAQKKVFEHSYEAIKPRSDEVSV
ncbi:uncharacterized protein LOC111498479 isoform X2 [Cucurbita maxima]|uniref:RING-type E3 ubiquitin transferase n=1 Tax=Cucurbita maxima TaxID=3661 RepID=A0A6J1KXL9_CUCMA|nr:uncharacterized protein LOC111498479 isoform X2 [Cucurbita maxima]